MKIPTEVLRDVVRKDIELATMYNPRTKKVREIMSVIGEFYHILFAGEDYDTVDSAVYVPFERLIE